MAFPPLTIDEYEGQLGSFLVAHVVPVLPLPEQLINWHQSILATMEARDCVYITRPFPGSADRGKIEDMDGSLYTIGDNEPAVWVYLRCQSGVNASEFKKALYNRTLPISMVPDPSSEWKAFGRSGDEDFGGGGWKLCHILDSRGGRPTNRETLRMRAIRLLDPFNHFPFPSPKRYGPRDWGEDGQVLDYIRWFMAHEYLDRSAAKYFEDFLIQAGVAAPAGRPVDPTVKWTLRAAFPSRASDSSRDSSSIERGHTCRSKDALVRLLEHWHSQNEATIGPPTVNGRTPWVHIRLGREHLIINADTKRAGVEAFLSNHARGLQTWRVVPGSRGTPNVVTNSEDGGPIPGFYCYAKNPGERSI